MVMLRLISRLMTWSMKRKAFLSTLAEPMTCYDLCRTSEDNPVNHNSNQEAKFYKVDPEVHKQLFSRGGIPNSLKENIETFNECAFMIRKPALEIKSYLERADYSQPTIRYVLYGREGVGKSVTMAHLLHYAFTKNWLIVHIPWAPQWTRKPREVIPSTTNPNYMDSPVEATLWLQHFRSQNLNLLNQLNICSQGDYEWSSREKTKKGDTLLSIVDHGIARTNHATDCVAVLLKEIKEQSKNGSFMTFVAMDGINAFFSPTTIEKTDKTILEVDKLVLVKAFLKLCNNDWTNAAVLAIPDKIAHPGIKSDSTPLGLFSPKGFELFEPFVPIKVDDFSRKEVESCLDYYCDRNWIQNEKGRSEMGREELIFLSGRNPFQLMRVVGPR